MNKTGTASKAKTKRKARAGSSDVDAGIDSEDATHSQPSGRFYPNYLQKKTPVTKTTKPPIKKPKADSDSVIVAKPKPEMEKQVTEINKKLECGLTNKKFESSLQGFQKSVMDAVMCAIDKFKTETIEKLTSEIKTLRDENEGLKFKLAELEEEVREYKQCVQKEVKTAYEQLDEMEQYTRKCSIRIYGIPNNNKNESIEDCVKKVHNILSEKLEMSIDYKDISIAHRLGKFSQDSPSPTIVKFVSRRHKIETIHKRKALKGTKIVIKEDLTRKKRNLLSKVSQCETVESSWTTDGTVFAKLKRTGYHGAKNRASWHIIKKSTKKTMQMLRNRRTLVVISSTCLIFLLIKSLPQLQGLFHLVTRHAQYNIRHTDAENFKQIHTDLKKPHTKAVDFSQIPNGLNSPRKNSQHLKQMHNSSNQPQKRADNFSQTPNVFRHPRANLYSGRLSFNCDGRVKRDNSKPTLVLGILSSNEHTSLRNIHRKSLRIYKSYPLNVVICFLLDQPTPNLLIESERNKDIVFLNTTSLGWGIKFGEKLYKWFVFVNTKFPDSDLVGKMDDDVFLCLPEIFERLKNVTNPRLYYGWQPKHKLAFKLFVRPDRLKFVNVTKWMDEMFIVVGKSLVKRIIKRTFCFDNSPLCDPLVDLVDSRYASDSLGLWLQIYSDVKMVSDNKYLVRFTPNITQFLKRDFCNKYILMHPIKSHKHITQMYKYTWNKSGGPHA